MTVDVQNFVVFVQNDRDKIFLGKFRNIRMGYLGGVEGITDCLADDFDRAGFFAADDGRDESV
ncbi:MAG: hypothetical protein ABFD66_05795 [Smithella sp.]